MPSPIVHLSAAAGLSVWITGRFPFSSTTWRWIALIFFFSMAPDLDAVPGVMTGEMARYHNQFTHSILWGLGFCALLTPLAAWWLKPVRWSSVFATATAAYGIHLLLDWLTYGRGLKLLWPFAETRFLSPYQPFIGVRWSEGLWTIEHVHTAINEVSLVVLVGFFLFGVPRLLQRALQR
jgi:inner membrane protein